MKTLFTILKKLICCAVLAVSSTAAIGQMATNPVLWADVPDPDIIRVGDTYYMVSTTMHFNPGAPIMKSKDLVTWETVGYVYDILSSQNETNLESGKNMYGKGSWAACLRYVNNYYYVYFLSYTTNKTHVYRTANIETGPWEAATMSGMHDLSVLFDDDGKVWSVYGGPDVQIRELTADGMAFKAGTTNRTLIPNAGSPAGTSFIVAGEGAHILKIDGMYYVFIITWPSGSGRTQVVWRSSSLSGPWEGKTILSTNGIAQGQIIQTPAGKWYGLLFKDNGAVGRIPYLTTVTWTNGWPMMAAPATLDIPASKIGLTGIVSSDDFNYSAPVKLNKCWQWNHNPDPARWSVSDRPGYLRITTGRTDAGIHTAKNTLTQRTYGPTSTGVVSMDAANMKNGDYAGLSAFQDAYGYVGVKMVNGAKHIVMVNAGTEVASVPLSQNTVYLRVDCDFKNQADNATFHYSLDGAKWTAIGNALKMSFKLTHFCGYRFGLFNYATLAAGGYVDFDYFKTGYDTNSLLAFPSSFAIAFTSPSVTAYTAPASVPIAVSAAPGASVARIDFYLDNAAAPFHADQTAPYAFDWDIAAAGTYTVRAIAYTTDGKTAQDSIRIKIQVPQAPYGGVAWPIPGTVQAEHYDMGGNGFAYLDNSAGNIGGATFRLDEDADIENCTDAGEGYNIGYATAGEWMEYTVNVAEAGKYRSTFRVACNGDGRSMTLSSGAAVLSKDIAVPNTGGWQAWADVTVEGIELAAGEQVLRLTIGAADYVNINFMSFAAENAPASVMLSPGWNLVGYPYRLGAEPKAALSSIIAHVRYVKDADGFYDTKGAAFLNSLTEMTWSKGYFVFVDAPCELQWVSP